MTYTSTIARTLDTDTLWERAHTALCHGHWSEARAWLDELGNRSDNTSTLCSIDTYMKDRAVSPDLRAGLRSLMADRIDLVNCKALAS